jgi:hypothetical protein
MNESTREIFSSKKIIIIGNLSLEGVTDKIVALGHTYKKRNPFSLPDTWISIQKSIHQLKENGELLAVIMYLTPGLIMHSCEPKYQEAWRCLLTELKNVPSLIFAPEPFLAGKAYAPEYSLSKKRLKKLANTQEANQRIGKNARIFILDEDESEIALQQEQRLKALEMTGRLLKTLQESGVEAVPYERNADVTLRIHHFLDDADKGVFLHLYVPNGRYQADQLESFLRLFENYLQRIEQKKFFIDLRRTSHGHIYVFRSHDVTSNIAEMETAISRFETFMDVCKNNPKQAESILIATGLQPMEANHLHAKYAKEYQRLIIDVRHDFEQKVLTLRHSLESEAFELSNRDIHTILPAESISGLLSLSNNSGPISINISSPSVNNNSVMQSFVEQTINGDITYMKEDKELLGLFERLATRQEAIVLKSELEQLKDTTSPEELRKTAKQKIIGFLYKVAPAVGQSALSVLTAYIQKVLTGS